MGKDNNSRTENNIHMYIEWDVRRDGGKGERDTISKTHIHTHHTELLTFFFLLDSSDSG